ncbi:nuclear transport factor 2 family protein [Ramlibacter sp. WS9]|uniref:nuclear transport factor 2 family protein n=1 Tax=Ramlibacter sp. WS9 TaxID=1882741 RepID=UPI001141787B|nr:nuclear transport factor 2 family protein [Ramlibacter sp. WS9]ROZ77022.1 nuclear transport factor 2 family protein [Ramlibacter sp. WS9]
MKRRRLIFAAFSVVALASSFVVSAQPSPEEKQLRDRLLAYQQAWNRHDLAAWSSFLSDDIWFTQALDFYGRQKGRESAETLFKSNFADSELTQDVKKVRMMPDGTATVAMREVVAHLPKTDGKYKAVFESEPVIGRWRKDAGVWKMFFFTSHKGWALDELKKDGVE